MRNLVHRLIAAGAVAVPTSLAIAYNPQAIHQDIAENIQYFCGYDWHGCALPAWESALFDWEDAYSSAQTELNNLMGSGACSNPSHPQYSYCGAVAQDVNDLYFLCDLIEASIVSGGGSSS